MKHKHRFACPCCGLCTLDARGGYDICPVCFWEDDPFQSEHPEDADGVNHISLRDARLNYARIGACSEEWLQHVRTPKSP